MSVVAALYDVHGNLPALDAVLADAAFASADAVVVGGDVAAGPLPAEVLDRLAGLDVPVRWVRGNADREVVAHFDRGDTDHEIYGADAPAERADAFTAARIARTAPRPPGGLRGRRAPRRRALLPRLAAQRRGDHHRVDAPRRGSSRCWRACRRRSWCAATPITSSSCARASSASSTPAASGCPTRAGPGAYWLLVADGEPELRRTEYDVDAAAAALRASGFPDVDDLIRESLVEPVDAATVARHFEDRTGT